MSAAEDIKAASGPHGKLIATGFGGLDRLAPIFAGDLMILASRAGHGSTAFTLKLGLNVARQSVPVLWFGLNHCTDDLMRVLLAAKGPDPADMAAAAMELAELPFSVVDSTTSSLSRIRDLTIDWRGQHEQPRSLVVVDLLQGVPYEPGWARSMRPVSEVEKAHQRSVAAGLKAMAKALGVSVVLLARHKAADRPPELSDLRYEVDEFADVVGFLHREPGGSSGQLIVAKQKNGPTGALDLALELKPKLRFNSDDELPRGAGHYAR